MAEVDGLQLQVERLGPLQEGDILVIRSAARIHRDVSERMLHLFEEIQVERGLRNLTVIILEDGMDISILKPEVMKQLGYVRG